MSTTSVTPTLLGLLYFISLESLWDLSAELDLRDRTDLGEERDYLARILRYYLSIIQEYYSTTIKNIFLYKQEPYNLYCSSQ